MIDCMILGDSIAVGVAQQRPECVAYAKVGINSRDWVNKNITKDLSANTVIISLGSNDHYKIHTFKELLAIRSLVTASNVFWILPANNEDIQANIRIIARNHKDVVLTIPTLSKDGVHPTGTAYKELAKLTK